MALHDLLQSIVHEADQQIAAAKEAHAARLQSMTTEHTAALERFRKTTNDRLQQKKRSLREKAESLGRISAGKMLLEHKNAALDALYETVLKELLALPKDELKAFFTRCLGQMEDAEGTLHAAPEHEAVLRTLAGPSLKVGEPLKGTKGGFTVSTAKREWNFTFEFLVRQALRPATDIAIASRLFAA